MLVCDLAFLPGLDCSTAEVLGEAKSEYCSSIAIDLLKLDARNSSGKTVHQMMATAAEPAATRKTFSVLDTIVFREPVTIYFISFRGFAGGGKSTTIQPPFESETEVPIDVTVTLQVFWQVNLTPLTVTEEDAEAAVDIASVVTSAADLMALVRKLLFM